MWILAGTIALLVVLALVLKVMERRASKDLDGAEDMSRILRGRLGRMTPLAAVRATAAGLACRPRRSISLEPVTSDGTRDVCTQPVTSSPGKCLSQVASVRWWRDLREVAAATRRRGGESGRRRRGEALSAGRVCARVALQEQRLRQRHRRDLAGSTLSFGAWIMARGSSTPMRMISASG